MKKSTQVLLVVAGVAFGGWYVATRARQVGAVLATKANPVSRENVAYQATGEVGTKVADWFGGLFKSEAERKVDAMLKHAEAQPLPQAADTTSMSGAGKVSNSWDYWGLL